MCSESSMLAGVTQALQRWLDGVLWDGGRFFNAGTDTAGDNFCWGVEEHPPTSAGQDTKPASSPLLYVQFNQSVSGKALSGRDGEEARPAREENGWGPDTLTEDFSTGGVVGGSLNITCSYKWEYSAILAPGKSQEDARCKRERNKSRFREKQIETIS